MANSFLLTLITHLIFSSCLLITVTSYELIENDKIGDRILALPGQPVGLEISQYSGYVSVDEAASKTLFYYFVESPQNSSAKPLVLWLNGGPGSSSFGSAFLELGPFRVKRDGKTLMVNPYSWHHEANMLFLDSPAGVGYSYGDESVISNKTGDMSTAEDTYVFLMKWLQRFPEYQGRDFYITGQDYAGHFAPQLAYTILHNNNNNNNNTNINLKGVAIGSPWIHEEINWSSMYENIWRRDMCSTETHELIFKNCNFSEFYKSINTKQCGTWIYKVADESGNTDFSNIYAPICNLSVKSDVITESVDVYDPCSETYLDRYTDRKEVQEALHIRDHRIWSLRRIFYAWQDGPTSVLPLIQWLSTNNIRIWLFSGDLSGYVPPLSTRTSLETLKLPTKTPWRAWYCNNKVGGYVVEFEGVTMLTVREAGHQVPAYQPRSALMVFSSFLQGMLPPDSP